VAPVPVPVAPAPSTVDFGSYEDRRYVEPPRRTGFFLLFALLTFAAVGLGLYYLSQQLDEKNDTTTIEVPDVRSQPRGEAREELADLGFVVAVQEEASTEVARNLVIRQEPRPGTTAAEGSTVTIVVSVGAENVAIPDVLGQDIFTATQALQDAGFVVSQEQADDPTGQFTQGQVWQQSPAAGTQVAVGSVVIIRVVPLEPTSTDGFSSETSPPETSPPATSPPATSPPATAPPVTTP
jgi:serine/threonine-protein kinase